MPEPMFDIGEFQVGGLSQDEEDELVDRVSREMVAGLADEPSPVQGLRIGDSPLSAPSLSAPSRTPPRTVDSPAFAGALSRSRPEPIGLADEIPTPDIRMSAEESARAFAPAQSALSAPEVEPDGLGLASDIESARSLATPPRRAMPDARPVASQGIMGLAETPDAASPFTDAEEAEIERGRRQDRRRKIGRAIAGILGLGVGVAGAAAGNFGVAELGNLAGSVGGAAPTNREAAARRDAMRGKAMRDQAQDRALELAARQQQAAALAQGQQRQEAELALRQQQAESGMALDTARRDAILADQANESFEREALAGNANGAREAIRARVAAIQHMPTRMAWEQRLNAEDSALDQVTDLNTLRAILGEVADTDIRRGGQGAGGSGGSSGRIRVDESGQTIAGPRPRRSAIAPPAVMPPAAVSQPPAASFDEGLGFPPTSAPAPAAARGGGMRRPVSPSTPTEPATTPAPTAPIDTRQARINAMRAAVGGDMTPEEFDVVNQALIDAGLSPEQLGTPDGQGVVRSLVGGLRSAPAGRRAELLLRAAEGLASELRGEVRLHPALQADAPRYYSAARRMTEAYEQAVSPFEAAMRSIARARSAGISDSDIRQAILAGSMEPGQMSAWLSERNAPAAVRNIATAMSVVRENYGRIRSGAAISAQEWSNFDRILGLDAALRDPDRVMQAMQYIARQGQNVVFNRAAEGGADPQIVFDQWRNGLRRARARRSR